ncbi:MAG: NlpC/P60 family protein [Clostridia bacterium]|nr:NlpC/P60 family protein [Clostridia bacterium]
MSNIKHTIAGIAAVVLIGSLVVSQAAEISSVNANKITEKFDSFLEVSDTKDDEVSDVVYIEDEPQITEELTDEEKQDAEQSVELIDYGKNEFAYANNVIEISKPFEPVSGYVITTTGGLNVRAAQSLDSEILDSLEYGQMIDIIDETDDWYVIPYGEDGQVGYVLKEYVTTSYDEAKRVLLENVMYESGVVTVEGGSLNVRSGPGTENTVIIDQIANGDCIVVLNRVDDEWMKVYYGNNYATGYVMSKYVSIGGMVARDKVAENRVERINAISEDGLFVFNGSKQVECKKMPTEDSNVINTFSSGDKCLIVSQGSEWTKIAYGPYRITGYVKSKYVMTKSAYDDMIAEREAKAAAAQAAKNNKTNNTAAKTPAATKSKTVTKSESNSNPAPSSKGQAIVNAAAKYLGVKYVYGGSSPSGFDCSGLVQYACKQAGISVNRTSRAQYSNGVAVSKSNLQAGDLVFFSKGNGISHVGIYAGNGQVIHSPRPGKTVCYIPLSTICGYSTYVGARRVY